MYLWYIYLPSEDFYDWFSKLFNSLGERELADVNRIIRKAISNNNGYQAILGSMVRLAAQFFSPSRALSNRRYTYLW